MIRRVLVFSFLVIIGAAATSVAASTPVTMFVDGREVQTDPPARIDNGRTLVPIRFVAESLGVPVYWTPHEDGGGEVHIFSYPREFTPPPGVGTGRADRSRPSDLNALGAATALMNFLVNEQALSLSREGQVLVRFELLDLRDLCFFPPPSDLKEFCGDGFRFAVRLYFVEMKDSSVPAGVAQYRRETTNGETTVETVGKDVAKAWYEDIILDVRPKGPPDYQKRGDGELVTYGVSGWEVDSGSKTILRKVTLDRSPFLVHGSYGR